MQETFTRWPYQKPKIEVIETEYDAAVALTNGTGYENHKNQLAKKRRQLESQDNGLSQDGMSPTSQFGDPWAMKTKSLWDD